MFMRALAKGGGEDFLLAFAQSNPTEFVRAISRMLPSNLEVQNLDAGGEPAEPAPLFGILVPGKEDSDYWAQVKAYTEKGSMPANYNRNTLENLKGNISND